MTPLEAAQLFNACTQGAANVAVIIAANLWIWDHLHKRASHRAQLAALERAGHAVPQAHVDRQTLVRQALFGRRPDA